MRVNTDELNRQAAELRSISAKINEIEDTVQWVSRTLCRERFGEMFRSPLYNMARTITGRAEELNRMSSALQQISALYENAEVRIIDEAEHANVHYEREIPTLIPIPGWWDFPWLREPRTPHHILQPIDPVEDVQVVNGLPTLDDTGWNEVVERVREAFDERHGRGYIPPVEIPVFEPISIPRNPTGQPSMIDWTPWDA